MHPSRVALLVAASLATRGALGQGFVCQSNVTGIPNAFIDPGGVDVEYEVITLGGPYGVQSEYYFDLDFLSASVEESQTALERLKVYLGAREASAPQCTGCEACPSGTTSYPTVRRALVYSSVAAIAALIVGPTVATATASVWQPVLGALALTLRGRR